ncbi:MAG: hypothetical protein KBO60_26570, partial [Achromobacter sp.]|nr:hypothetical protein [Achromobacter sp.]
MAKQNETAVRKVVAASLIGATIEWYDFFLYGVVAGIVFNKLYFPTGDPLVSTMLAYTTFAVGFITRPLGGLVFGDLAWRPPTMLVAQIMLLTTVQALVMVTGAVVVSSQTTSTRAANLLASFIIIPMALIIQGESVIMFLAPDAESPNGISALWAIIV